MNCHRRSIKEHSESEIRNATEVGAELVCPAMFMRAWQLQNEAREAENMLENGSKPAISRAFEVFFERKPSHSMLDLPISPQLDFLAFVAFKRTRLLSSFSALLSTGTTASECASMSSDRR